jgi:BTB/POZ domain
MKETKNVKIEFEFKSRWHTTNDSTSITLMDSLYKSHSIDVKDAKIHKVYTKLRDDLETAVKDQKNKMIEVIPLPQSIQQLLTNFRSCLDNDRMTFVCSDGSKIHSHKSVLSLYNPVFKACFEGPWSETHPDGAWKTIHPSHLINFLLDYMYSSKVDQNFISSNYENVFAAAHKFQLTKLCTLSRDFLIDSINFDNVRDILETAYLYDDELLLAACYEFVECNMEDILLEPSFACLAGEQPDLWENMFQYLRPQKSYSKYDPGERKKRSRSDNEKNESEKIAKLSEATTSRCQSQQASSSTR